MNSKLHLFSLGIIAENKELDSKIVKVTPIELIPLSDGEVKENETVLESKGLNSEGVEYTVQVKVDITVDAEWLSLETNRRTAPDVRRGEQVLIFRYGDTDKFYWTSMGRDDHLRRLETIIYTWSDESNPDKDIDITDQNHWFLEISTHKKTATFKTCKNDGEAFEYTIQVNAKESKVVVTDDNMNYCVLDSANTKIHFHNADGTDFALDKKDITGYAPNDMKLKIDNNVDIKVGNDFTMDVGNNTSVTTGMAMTFQCTTYSLTATASIDNVTAKYTTTCPLNTFTGNLLIGGALAVSGGGGGGGAACQVTGTVGVEGDMEVTGIIKCGGLQSDTPPTAPGGSWHNP
jgi:hypothetical protein